MPNIPSAVSEGAKKAQAETRVPASVSIAQWALESGWGAHAPGNNPFGMKPRKGKSDPQQLLWTTEWSRTKGYYKVQQPFRTFPTLADAFVAHALLISTAPVYKPAMGSLPDKDAFIDKMALRYATDPQYSKKIKSIIKQNSLERFDSV